MAQPPPRPAAARAGELASPGPGPSSDDNQQPATFFLGRYRVVDEIGVGGMASVHLARMDGPGGFQKWVAIKRIHPHLVEDDQFVDMFLDEARIAAGINHANVAQVFDLGKDENTYWIAMEYLHGEPLREVMRRAEDHGQRISPELAARICADAAEGLHAAHELRGKNGQLLGLVHRDVTPHNLFVTYDGYTKVVDFGIAKVADRLSSTRAGTLKGKLAYMSPEQVRGAEVDRTTDIFALGVVLWEVTTNQRLFRMDTDLDTLEKVQACVVPPPSTIVPGFPLELEACLLKALAKRKQDRYQTAREFSRALQQYLVRSGHFVGPEEVAQFIRGVFGDRIQKREAHLAWAAEVTSTVDVQKLRVSRADVGPPTHDERQPRLGAQAPVNQATPASGARPVQQRSPVSQPMAAQSLMDDDEDVPTTVATRDALEAQLFSSPRPAAGFPPSPPAAPPPRAQPTAAMPAVPAMYPSPASYAANSGISPRPANNGPPSAASYAANSGHARPGFGSPAVANSEHTAAIPSPAEDLGSTVALPIEAGMVSPSFAQFANNAPPPSYPQPPPPPLGARHAGYAPAPTFGPQVNPQLTPAGIVGGVPMNLPVTAAPGAPQSQIETALSLPRPDPAALWLAQQEKQKGERRNTGVLIAVVLLTALCVIGIGTLVFLKLRHNAATDPQAVPSVTATVASTASEAPAATPSSAAPAGPTAQASASASASATASASTPPPGVGRGTKPTGASAAPKESPGFLSVVCNPYCDDVLDNGRSLGPSPIVHLPVPPGSHRLTLKKGSQTKVLSAIVVSGQVTQQKVSMK